MIRVHLQKPVRGAGPHTGRSPSRPPDAHRPTPGVLAEAGFLCAVALLAAACNPDREFFEARIEGRERPRHAVAARASARRDAGRALGTTSEKTILFGDLHVHTSYSFDGYLFALPLIGGEGAHPPNDACDFARYCADLDFFALTDHAESLLPETWASSRESIRRCNGVAGDPSDPDVVAFLGFEWSQAGATPEEHFGHRCVFFRETDDDRLPTRPIASPPNVAGTAMLRDSLGTLRWITPWHWQQYGDYMDFSRRLLEQPRCAPDVAVRNLPDDCTDVAETPAVLREKLDDWGFDAVVIPHGTAWGTYTPATATIDKHLDPSQFDPERQLLVEVMSGHGNAEEYRSWREWIVDERGERICPEPTADYLPCCWQAGEIMRSRCSDLPEDECERRVREARRLATRAYTRPQQVFPDAPLEAWLDCGQCRDCFKPAFAYRPRESIQYAMALSHPDATDAQGRPLRFRYGFVASSDGHTARPGTGYKAVERSMMTDVVGEPSALVTQFQKYAARMDDPQRPRAPETGAISLSGNDLRISDFLYPGGIAAVHSTGRSREEIWAAMQRREVYGTSGPRILLWFDLLDDDGSRRPMGSHVERRGTPRFEVRAAGAPVQKPGCPSWVHDGLSAERLARLCRNECNHPDDARHPITAIEVVRIRPQLYDGEEIEPRIEDPWQRFPCPPDPAGCRVTFDDPDFAGARRDTLYYVRAVQAETPEINGQPLHTEFDERGRAVSIDVCEPGSGDCLAPSQERAWSSPIFVDWARATGDGSRPGGPSRPGDRSRPSGPSRPGDRRSRTAQPQKTQALAAALGRAEVRAIQSVSHAHFGSIV